MDRVFAFFRRSRCLIALVVIVLLVFRMAVVQDLQPDTV